MSTKGLHNTALCQPYYVNQPRPVKFFQAAASWKKLEAAPWQLADCTKNP